MKRHGELEIRNISAVAPRRGAWIETPGRLKARASAPVAPRRGAWIETSQMAWQKRSLSSHPAGVRGLKLCRKGNTIHLLHCRTPQGCVD